MVNHEEKLENVMMNQTNKCLWSARLLESLSMQSFPPQIRKDLYNNGINVFLLNLKML